MFPSLLPIKLSPPTPLPSPEDRSAPPTYLDEFAPFGEPQSYPQKSPLSETQRVTRATDDYIREKHQQRSKLVDFWKSWAYSSSFMDTNPCLINLFRSAHFPNESPPLQFCTLPRSPSPTSDTSESDPAEIFMFDGDPPEVTPPPKGPLVLVYPPPRPYPTSTDPAREVDYKEFYTPEVTEALDVFCSATSRHSASAKLVNICDSLPPSVFDPYSVFQLVSLWLSRCCFPDLQFKDGLIRPSSPSPSPSPPPLLAASTSAFVYKKVANKTRPVATTLPEDFRIIRLDHPDPLADMLPLPTNPPNFAPTSCITRERCNQMEIGKNFLLPEEIKLVEWIICAHDTAFAWTDEERGAFDPEYFAPIEIPHISHVPWVLRQGPIPRRSLNKVTEIIKNKWRSGVYEPSSSSYNSRWFCIYKKDGKSLRLVHSLEPLNAITIKNAAMPPYTNVVAEDFAGRSIYTTLDLYVSFDQRQLHPNSHDMTTFNTPLGAFCLTVLPMGWTNSPTVLQGDVTHILRPKIPHLTQPFADDVPIKGPCTRYVLPDGSYETIPENSGIRRFVWEHLQDVHRIIQHVKSYGAMFSGKKAFIEVPQADILGHICTPEGRVADSSRIQAILDWPLPTTVSEV